MGIMCIIILYQENIWSSQSQFIIGVPVYGQLSDGDYDNEKVTDDGTHVLTLVRTATDSYKILASTIADPGKEWVQGPGQAAYVNSLLIDSYELNPATAITIIGDDILGLFTAYDLIQRGYTNITMVARGDVNAVSGNSAEKESFCLVASDLDSADKNNGTVQNIVVEYTCQFYKKIAYHNTSILREGLVYTTLTAAEVVPGASCYMGTDDPQCGNNNEDYSFILIKEKTMECLLRNFVRARVSVIKKDIIDITEIHDQFIIDCKGYIKHHLLKKRS